MGKVIAVTVVISTLAACGGDDSDAGDADATQLDVAAADLAATAEAGDSAIAIDGAPATDAPAAAPGGGDGSASAAPIDIGVVGRDVIIEMHVVLGSDDIERSVASISADASALGGGIASSDIDYQTAADGTPTGHAVLVVKVPPSAVDRLLDGLDNSGVVQSIDQTAQDVTDQLVDLDVRIANAGQSVTNVRQFMEATTNLTELVSLEAELTRRQTELEQLEAQKRNLSDRVALSTITVEVVPRAALPQPEPEPEDRTIGSAFRDGWDAFATFFVAIAFVIAVLAPFAALALLVLILVWRVRRVLRESTLRRAPAPAPAADDVRVTDDELVSSSQRE